MIYIRISRSSNCYDDSFACLLDSVLVTDCPRVARDRPVYYILMPLILSKEHNHFVFGLPDEPGRLVNTTREGGMATVAKITV